MFKLFNSRKILILLLFIIFFSALGTIYFKYSLSIDSNSDQANIILEAADNLKGNVFLKDWTIPSDNFITIDIPVYIIFVYFMGLNPLIMNYVPVIIYTFIVIISLYITTINRESESKYVAGIISFIIIALPSAYFLNIALIGPIHTGTIFLILISFLSLYKFHNNNRLWIVLLIILPILYITGDPFSLVIGLAPILATEIVLFFYEPNKFKNKNLIVIITLLIDWAIAKALYSYIASNGANILTSNLLITNITRIKTNLDLANISLLNLLNINLSSYLLFIIPGITILVCIIYSFYIQIKHIKESAARPEVIPLLAGFGIVFNYSAFLLSNSPIDATSSRYLLPLVIFSGILCGSTLSPVISKNKVNKIILLLIIIIPAISFVFSFYNHKQQESPYYLISIWLKDHNLIYGYAGYWDASITTVESKGDINISSVIESNGTLHPFLWLASSHNYDINNDIRTNHVRNFVLIKDSNEAQKYKTAAINTFGPPAYIYIVNKFHILVWVKGIIKPF